MTVGRHDEPVFYRGKCDDGLWYAVLDATVVADHLDAICPSCGHVRLEPTDAG